MSYEYGQQPATAIVPTDPLSGVRAATLLDPSVILAGQLAAELPVGTTLTANNGATAGVALDRSTMVIDGVTSDALYELVAANHSFSVAAPASVFDVGEGSWFWYVAVRGPNVGDPIDKRGAIGVRLNLNSGRVLTVFAGADSVSTPHPLEPGLWYGLWGALTRDAETGAPGILYCGDGFATIAEIQLASVAVLAANLDDPGEDFMIGEMANSDEAFAVLFKGAQLAGFDAHNYAKAAQKISELLFSQPSQQHVGQTTMASTTGAIDFPLARVILGQNPGIAPLVIGAGVRAGWDHLAEMEQSPAYKQSGVAVLTGGYLLTLPPTMGGGLATYAYRTQCTSNANTELTVVSELGAGLTLIPPDLGTVLVTIDSVSQSSGVVREFDIVQLHSETVLPGVTLTGRIVYTSLNAVTLTIIPNSTHVEWIRLSK